MQLSIIIPSYQRTDLLELCLTSMLRFSPPGTEIIVVDDASRKGTISAVGQRFGVNVVRLPQRRGFCAAVNAGVAAARGGIVELLNDDAEVTSGWAEAAMPWFDDPAVAAVAPLVLIGPEGDHIDSAGDRYYVGGVAGKRWHGKPLAPMLLRAEPVFGASGSSAFYRREALVRVGGFPEEFTAYFDDVDVAFRLQRAGYRTIFEPASRVLHRVSASYGRRSRRLLEQQSLNEERVFWRNLPGPELLRALPIHLAVLAGKAHRRWREGTLSPFLCGRLRMLKEIGQLLQHRRRLSRLGPVAPLEAWYVERGYWG